MPKFTGRVLKRLDSIWRFVGGVQGLSDMNLEGSVQPVEDLSRQAELGSGLGASDGYFMQSHVFVFGAAGGTTRNTTDPWAFVDTFEPQRVRASVWLLGCWAANSNANVENAGVSMTTPIIGDGSVDARELLIGFFNGNITLGIASAGIECMWARAFTTEGQGNMGLYSHMPLWIPDGAILNFMGDAAGAGTVYITCMCWAGAAGARPPGLA